MSYKGALYINGSWREGRGEAFSSTNPATGETLWQGRAASHEDVNLAVASARSAFADWGYGPLEGRLNIIKKFQSIIELRKEELALTLARETGKILWDARSEIAAMIGKFQFSLAAYNERAGERHNEGQGGRTSLRHRPHGVVAVYGPYNFPAHLPNGHIIPALIAGNTVIFKPSELAPLVAEKVVECWQEAGIPEGVVNLVQGEREAGKMLSVHPWLDGLFFTGSSATGQILSRQFAETPHKILALELGGNNPLIVHEVADAKAAAYLAIQSAYVTSGQRCTCARRLIVPGSKGNEAFIDTLVRMVETIKVGKYDDMPEPYMGPLIADKEVGKLLGAQASLVEHGGRSLVAMRRLHPELPFISPGLIDVTESRERPDAEWFGPLLQLVRVADMDEAVKEANNTQYGLSAGIFTDHRKHYEAYLTHARAGIVNWNRPLTGSSGALPFGGIGLSGNHRPAAYYAADYCAYPLASNESDKVMIPDQPTPGLVINA